MSNYRIIKKCIFDLTGSYSYRGYYFAYLVQRKRWWGGWSKGEPFLCVEDAETYISLLKSNKIDSNGNEIIKEIVE